jgi:hypothetical protein
MTEDEAKKNEEAQSPPVDHGARLLASLDAAIEIAKELKHWSDCAVLNEPAFPNGPCNCGGYRE